MHKRSMRVVSLLLLALSLAACGAQLQAGPEDNINNSILFKGSPQPDGFVFVQLPTHEGVVRVPVFGDLAIYNGDIVVADLSVDGPASQSTVISYNSGKWPFASSAGGYRIPYAFASGVSQTVRNQVGQAIADYNAKTKIRFVPRSNSDRNYVRIVSTSGTCYSYVGRIGRAQDLGLDSQGRCGVSGAIHELGHAAGLWHEQSRKDRDNFVEILYQNIAADKAYNFDIEQNSVGVGGYDYSSIMHYSAYAFSTNGQPTIRPRNSSIPLSTLGSSSTLTPTDVQGLNTLYP